MNNKTKEMLEIIDGFQNLTSKIKDDHDSIKKTLKNKETIIAACKSEYQKLHKEYEELKKKYVELIKENEEKKKILKMTIIITIIIEKKLKKEKGQLLKKLKKRK